MQYLLTYADENARGYFKKQVCPILASHFIGIHRNHHVAQSELERIHQGL